MKVHLDADKCVGHGRCYALALDVYDADDDGHCIVRFDGDMPTDLVEAALKGVHNCPEDALSAEGRP